MFDDIRGLLLKERVRMSKQKSALLIMSCFIGTVCHAMHHNKPEQHTSMKESCEINNNQAQPHTRFIHTTTPIQHHTIGSQQVHAASGQTPFMHNITSSSSTAPVANSHESLTQALILLQHHMIHHHEEKIKILEQHIDDQAKNIATLADIMQSFMNTIGKKLPELSARLAHIERMRSQAASSYPQNQAPSQQQASPNSDSFSVYSFLKEFE